MFILWGTAQTDRKLGRVADYCPICDEARACHLIEMYKVPHLYYIPLGRGKTVGHLAQCEHCRDRFSTDLDRYLSISKDRRMTVEKLTDTTHPLLIERIAEWLEFRDRAEHGEVDENERIGLIEHPFKKIAYAVGQQRASEVHIDGQTVFWILSLIPVPMMVFFVCSALGPSWVSVDIQRVAVIGSFCVMLLMAVVSVAGDTRRRIRRQYWRFLVEFIAPLNPTAEELRKVILDLKRDKDTTVVGKGINPDKLHQDITAYRDDSMLQV